VALGQDGVAEPPHFGQGGGWSRPLADLRVDELPPWPRGGPATPKRPICQKKIIIIKQGLGFGGGWTNPKGLGVVSSTPYDRYRGG
jgi:hypothetical protein